jgi:tRNA(adenine34) deaminase
MTNEEKMQMTIEEGRKSLINKEFPVGAIIFKGDEVISRAHSSGESALEFLPHAEMAALLEADKRHYLPPDRKKMQLFTTLEPCMMCLGAAMSFFIGEIFYALEAPIDGAAEFAVQFFRETRREIPGYSLPAIQAGLLRRESQNLLRDYIRLVPGGPLVEYSKSLMQL